MNYGLRKKGESKMIREITKRWICEKEQNGWTLKDFKENVMIEQN